MTPKGKKAELPERCLVNGVLHRPSLDEAKAYYSRDDVLDELLGGMRHWHVRLEPGEGLRHRWLRLSDRGQFFVDVARGHRGTAWYDLSELLRAAGLRSEAGPWDTPLAAVRELERYDVIVRARLADPSFMLGLAARR